MIHPPKQNESQISSDGNPSRFRFWVGCYNLAARALHSILVNYCNGSLIAACRCLIERDTMFRLITTCAALALATPLMAEVTIETAQGPVTVAKTPETVAAYDVAAIDTLTALGVTPQGVIKPLFVPYLAEANSNAAVVGSIFEPDLEALNALSPDLVVVGGRSSKQLEPVSKIAPAVDMTIWGDVVGDGLKRLDAYGALFGKEDKAAELRTRFEASLAAAQEAVADEGRALILMTNGPKVTVYGAGGRFGWLHKALNLPEASEGIADSTHGEAISFEFIRETNPDILLVIDRAAAIGQEGEAAAAVLDNELVRETNAWKNGKVMYLDGAEVYISAGGIQSLTNTMDDLTAAFGGS